MRNPDEKSKGQAQITIPRAKSFNLDSARLCFDTTTKEERESNGDPEKGFEREREKKESESERKAVEKCGEILMEKTIESRRVKGLN